MNTQAHRYFGLQVIGNVNQLLPNRLAVQDIQNIITTAQ